MQARPGRGNKQRDLDRKSRRVMERVWEKQTQEESGRNNKYAHQ